MFATAVCTQTLSCELCPGTAKKTEKTGQDTEL